MIRRACAVAASVLVLAGCGDDGLEPVPRRDGATAAPSAPGLQVRPVLGPAEPGAGPTCDDSGDPPLPGNAPADQEATLCDLDGTALRLGPAALAGGVERVRVSQLPGLPEFQALGIRLEQEAAGTLRDLVSTAASSDSRVAVVVDGVVLNTLTVASTVGGRLLLVGVEVPREQAEVYAEALAS